MHWYLVLLLLSTNAPAAAQFAVPYTSAAACQAAIATLNAGLAQSGTVNAAWSCVEER